MSDIELVDISELNIMFQGKLIKKVSREIFRILIECSIWVRSSRPSSHMRHRTRANGLSSRVSGSWKVKPAGRLCSPMKSDRDHAKPATDDLMVEPINNR